MAEKNLPELAAPETLHTLDVAGLQAQMSLTQQAIELLAEAHTGEYEKLTELQRELSRAQNEISAAKHRIKILTNDRNKYLERIKVLKILVKAEKE